MDTHRIVFGAVFIGAAIFLYSEYTKDNSVTFDVY